MKLSGILIVAGCLLASDAFSQITPIPIGSAPNATVNWTGNLEQGQKLPDLSWAWSSQNACFPATRQEHFQGYHQLYLTELPEHSELSITLVPDDPSVSLSLYAYSFSGALHLIPDLPSCVSCEASYYPVAGNDRQLRSVSLRAVNHPYQVIIGVAGAKGVQSGKYQLELNLK